MNRSTFPEKKTWFGFLLEEFHQMTRYCNVNSYLEGIFLGTTDFLRHTSPGFYGTVFWEETFFLRQ